MKTSNEKSFETITSQFSARSSRRSLLRKAAIGTVGVAGATAASMGILSTLPQQVHAATKAGTSCSTDSIQDILNIAATAEQLAVTFYANGIANANVLGISGQNLNYLTAAIVEEQIHQKLLVKAGAKPLTGTFSFPHGAETFRNLNKFIHTLDQLETAFESAYLAAIKEFADMGQSGLAQLAGQIVTVEAEHRALGRSISTTINTANNWVFTPVFVSSVGQAVTVLSNEGYLSPTTGNTYTYQEVKTDDKYVGQRTPYVASC